MKSFLMFFNLLMFILCIFAAAIADNDTDTVYLLLMAALNATMFELNREK